MLRQLHLLPFILAVLLAAALGSLVQTQCNLAELQALGAPMPLTVRLHSSGLDLLGFGPTFALLAAAGFACALPLACWLKQRWRRLQWPLFALAGALAIWTALAMANAVAPVPTLIAADRSLSGTLGLMLAGSGGSLFYAHLTAR